MKNRFEIRGEVTVIFLRRKDSAPLESRIDTDDLPIAQTISGRWKAQKDLGTGRFYVLGKHRSRPDRYVFLHRLILSAKPKMEVDHINHDTLDNRRHNIRSVTKSENLQNRIGATRRSESGIRNVSWYKRTQKWRARITVNKEVHYLGHYPTKEAANLAAEKARARSMPCSKEAGKFQEARG